MGNRTFQDIIEAAGLPTLNHSAGFGEECLAFTYEGIRIGKYIAKIVAEIRENADQEAVVEAFRVMRENNCPCLWALVNPDERHSKRQFRLAGTGHPIIQDEGALRFVGTIQLHGGSLVFHLFELLT